MANFYTDNPDLKLHLQHPLMRKIVALKERDFADAEKFDYAPLNYDDAMDNYNRVLEIVGELCGTTIADNAADVDHDGPTVANGRVTYAPGTQENLAACRKAGLDNISLDLIYGLPDQTLEQWENTLADALVLAPWHISCYGLKLEEGTPLYDRRESLNLPDGDLQADMYLYAVELLGQNGYQQYEISNFAQPGYESRHNLKYWMLEEYAGFGPGAYSDFGGVRYGYTRDLDGYIAGRLDLAESERISPQEREMEYIMLRLRTARGIDIREFENRFRQRFAPLAAILESCAAHGLARQTETGWCLTPRGFLVSNRIIGDLQEELNREKAQRLARAAQGDYRVVE